MHIALSSPAEPQRGSPLRLAAKRIHAATVYCVSLARRIFVSQRGSSGLSFCSLGHPAYTLWPNGRATRKVDVRLDMAEFCIVR